MAGLLLVPSGLAAREYVVDVSPWDALIRAVLGGPSCRDWQTFARSRLAKNNWPHSASVVYVPESRLPTMASIALRLASSSARKIARFPTPSLSQTKRTRLTPRRNLHTRTPLPYDIDNGLGDFLTPQALRMIAIDYQQGLLDRLNEQVHGACLGQFDARFLMLNATVWCRYNARTQKRRANRDRDCARTKSVSRFQLCQRGSKQWLFP